MECRKGWKQEVRLSKGLGVNYTVKKSYFIAIQNGPFCIEVQLWRVNVFTSTILSARSTTLVKLGPFHAEYRSWLQSVDNHKSADWRRVSRFVLSSSSSLDSRFQRLFTTSRITIDRSLWTWTFLVEIFLMKVLVHGKQKVWEFWPRHEPLILCDHENWELR